MNNIIKKIENKLSECDNNNDIYFHYIGLHELVTKYGENACLLTWNGDDWNAYNVNLHRGNLTDVIATLYLFDKYGVNETLNTPKGKLPTVEEVKHYAIYCSSYTPMYIHTQFNLKEVNGFINDIAKYVDPKSKAPKVLPISNVYDLGKVKDQFGTLVIELNDKKQPKNMKPIKTNKGSDLDIDQNKPENNVVIQGQSTPAKHLESFKNLNSKLSNLVKIYNDDFNSTLGELYNTALKAHKAAFEIYLTLDLTSGYKISTLKETEEVDVVDVKNYSINRTNPKSVLADAMGTLRYYREEYDHLTDYIQKSSEEIENLRIK